MPRGDRTGPLGYGPMTGRGAGYCAGNSVPGYMNPVYGRGRGPGGGRGFGGGGRGWRNMFYATGLPFWARGYPPVSPAWGEYGAPVYQGELTPEREMEALKNQTGFFQKQIDAINERIRELEGIVSKNE
ncbi:MAG: DUF5320 domain-containing protein [Spirochaetes bacterium]|nr:DUF5320 domain-containing protein [Spirochaetota bacterium]